MDDGVHLYHRPYGVYKGYLHEQKIYSTGYMCTPWCLKENDKNA